MVVSEMRIAVFVTLFSATLVAGEHCRALNTCKDAVITEFVTGNNRTLIPKQQFGHLDVYQLDATKEDRHALQEQGKCKEIFKVVGHYCLFMGVLIFMAFLCHLWVFFVDLSNKIVKTKLINLANKNEHMKIAGFFIQACSANNTASCGRFLDGPPTEEWLPVTCAYSQDSILSKILSKAQTTVSVKFCALCTNEIKFRYVVLDTAHQVHGPYTTTHMPRNKDLQQDYKERTDNTAIHERVRRATTGHLVIGNRLYIHQLSLDGARAQTIVSGLSFAASVDFHFQQGHLYWGDRTDRRIMRSNLDGSMKTTLLDQGIGLPEGVAVDWISDKVYWADFSRKEIGVIDLNTTLYKTLISTGSSSNPRGVVLDPIRRMIFWTDWISGSPKIERASMDGTARMILHNTDLSRPYAITLDYSSQTLYWADEALDKIESSNLDGSNRRVILSSSGVERPFDITVFEGILYWSDWAYGVRKANVSDGQATTLYDQNEYCDTIFPFGIQVISELRQPQALNPCGSNNGGCSHFCLLSSTQTSNYSCDCPDGMVLQSDSLTCTLVSSGTTATPAITTQGSCSAAGYSNSCCVNNTSTCEGSQGTCFCDAKCHLLGDCCTDVPDECSSLQDLGPYILFTNKRYIHALSLDGTRTRTLHNGLRNAIGIDYHYRMDYMFWTDIDTNEIWGSRLDGSNARLLLGTVLRTPEDVAVDWISDKLYWTDNALDTISVMDLNSGVYTTVVDTGADTIPRSIVVDPLNRMMYWTDRSNTPRIESASMDGTDRRVIHSSSLVFPDGLTLDLSTQTLYWVDFQRDVLESSNVIGTNRRTVISANIFQPFGVTLLDDTLYYTDWLIGISSANRTVGNVNILFDNVCENGFGIEVISEDRQPSGSNPCGTNNGGCSHLCLLSATNSSGYSCLCPAEFILDTDYQTCISETGTTSTPTPADSPGSCVAANIATCCTSGTCRGYPPTCFCNAQCVSFRDCCHDFDQICPDEPRISITDDLTIIVNETVAPQFHCTVSAAVALTIIWTFTSDISQVEQQISDSAGSLDATKYSIEVPGSNQHSSILTVSNAQFTDAGVYKCFVIFGEDRIENSSRLTVLVRPSMLQLSVNRDDIRESQTLQLNCMLRAHPNPTVSWIKSSNTESTAILNGARSQITTQHSVVSGHPVTTSVLSVNNVRATDSGNYVCEAHTEIQGSSTVSASRNVDIVVINECLTNNQPCQNGGTCVDLVNGYSCICAEGFFDTNCHQAIGNEEQAAPVINVPPDNVNTNLTTAVTLTCTAEGHPAPRYEWYRDDELLPGETLPYLYIPEALPEDRGNYTCKAINEEGETESEPARLDIPGVYQYVASVSLTPSMANSGEEVLSIVGLTNNDTTFYSIEVLNSTTSTTEGAAFLITVLTNMSTTLAVRRLIYAQLEGSGTVASVNSLIRHDGCNPEVDPTINNEWPEASIGEIVRGPCPCEEFLPEHLIGEQKAVRYCEGSNRGGGVWTDSDYSQCETVVNELSQGLCNDLMNLMESPVNSSESIVMRTSQPQNLTAIDVVNAVQAVVFLTEEATVNPEVRDNYLSIIDNLQMADAETVLESQTSSSVLESLGSFLDRLEIPMNAAENQTVLSYQTYAIQVQDIDPERFNGQTLNIDLGSVEEAMNIGGSIDEDALITSKTAMNILTNATGTIQMPESVFSYCSQKAMESLNLTSQRLSYSVFLSDTLFQTLNATFKIGSLILAARLSCGSNTSLPAPLTVTLRTNPEIEINASDSSCATWDSNGFGAWSSDGCREVARSENQRVCECTQLAHFGILFDLNPQPVSPEVALFLAVVTYIGLVLSLVCLIIFIITYLAIKKLRTSIHGKILVNMSVSLMGLYISFLIGGHVTSVKILCGFTAAFLHYFMLVFFAWTSVEALWLYLKLVKVIGVSKYEPKFIPVTMLIVWLTPLLLVAISAGAGHRYYTNPFYCRATEWPFWFGLILPFLLMYLFDWVMFFTIMGSICKHRKAVHTSASTGKTTDSLKVWKQNFVIAIGLSISFGLGWGFGLLATSHNVRAISTLLQVLFSIFVGAQGVLIFAFHGIRNTDARNSWKKLLEAISRGPRRAYNIAHSVSQERNLTTSPSTDSYGLSVGRNTDTNASSVAATETFVNTKANEAYGKVAVTQSAAEVVYDYPVSVMSPNQTYETVRPSRGEEYAEASTVTDQNEYEPIPV